MEEFSLGNAVNPPPWRALPELKLAPQTLAELLDGGQAFRWNRVAGTTIWRGVWQRHAVELEANSADRVRWRPLTPETTESDLRAYLGDTRGFDTLSDALPWRSDPVLAAAMAAFPGLRILQQDLGEALLTFICSSTKRIVQIKAMAELLAERFGDPLLPGIHALPTWDQLAHVPEADLCACKLGYRARYLHQTAQVLATQPDWRTELATLPYTEARDWLVQLPGVGEKVADCVLLFGGGRLEAFPVDTWIVQALAGWYALDGWNPRQLAQFGRVHFGPTAGLAQQYLFAAARSGALRVGNSAKQLDDA